MKKVRVRKKTMPLTIVSHGNDRWKDLDTREDR